MERTNNSTKREKAILKTHKLSTTYKVWWFFLSNCKGKSLLKQHLDFVSNKGLQLSYCDTAKVFNIFPALM